MDFEKGTKGDPQYNLGIIEELIYPRGIFSRADIFGNEYYTELNNLFILKSLKYTRAYYHFKTVLIDDIVLNKNDLWK